MVEECRSHALPIEDSDTTSGNAVSKAVSGVAVLDGKTAARTASQVKPDAGSSASNKDIDMEPTPATITPLAVASGATPHVSPSPSELTLSIAFVLNTDFPTSPAAAHGFGMERAGRG